MEYGPLLIEIGLEELPAIPFLKELPNIESKWQALLNEHALESSFSFFYTPRRMVFWHEKFPLKQADTEEELFGPPVEIAYKDGAPTKAAEGFAKKCGIDVSAIEKMEKDGREVLYFKRQKTGTDASVLLGEMIPAFLQKLHFGKAMRWGDLQESFIRPIRWMNCLLDEKALPLNCYGVNATPQTYGHRTLSYDSFTVSDSKSYFNIMEKQGVILDQEKRKSRILEQIKTLESQYSVHVEMDEELLAEIVAITEYPTALLGSFEEKFLALPPEVIITSMKEHQRYFSVFKEGKLTNHFLVVSNARADDFSKVLTGNEKVLRARLSDALFFWHNDLKNGLHPDGLKNIVFTEGLGSLFDKVERELELTLLLFEIFKHELMDNTRLQEGELKALLERATMLGKADLLSEMVYEFTELQGIMGYYYASKLNEHALVANAIKDQYLPLGEESEMPSNLFSSLIALAHKLDNLMALFSAGKIPTGSKDPFALRRAAQGIVQIILDQDLPLNLKDILEKAKAHYKSFDLDELENFFLERYYNIFDCNPSIIKAVIQSGERNLLELANKIDATHKVTSDSDFKERFSTFKRVANITKDIDINADLNINDSLLEEAAEKELYETYQALLEQTEQQPDYQQKLTTLFSIKPKLDAFFDNVMVNAEDQAIRTNRKNLVASIYKAFYSIADLKEISI